MDVDCWEVYSLYVQRGNEWHLDQRALSRSEAAGGPTRPLRLFVCPWEPDDMFGTAFARLCLSASLANDLLFSVLRWNVRSMGCSTTAVRRGVRMREGAFYPRGALFPTEIT
jgi:hypothetical protein